MDPGTTIKARLFQKDAGLQDKNQISILLFLHWSVVIQLTSAALGYEDLWRMPAGEVRQELVNGEVIEMPLVGALHGMVTVQVAHLLYEHMERHGRGKVVADDIGFVLNLRYDPERVRGADVAFISEERLPDGETALEVL